MNVTIFSREEAEAAVAEGSIPSNAVVISFHDPDIADYGDSPVEYGDIKHLYCGVVDEEPDGFREGEFSYEKFLPEAPDIALFIYEAFDSGMDLICQCEYGQSRSAGCAAAILQHFYGTGLNIFTDYKRYPNRLIYHKIFDELEKLSETRKA
jgi:hypothetical protein